MRKSCLLSLCLAIVLCITPLIVRAGETERYDLSTAKGEAILWYWGDLWIDTFAIMNEQYPDLKVTQVSIPSDDYFSKFQIAITAGTDIPDICAMPENIRGKMISMDIWENLEEAPYALDRSLLLDYIIPASVGADGGIVGIENGVSPGILAYKRGAAAQYLGVEQPEDLEKLLTSWDAMEEVGERLRDASEGKCFLFASIGELFQCLYYQNPRALVQDGKVVADEVLGDIYERIARMRDKGLINEVEQWSPAWNATMSTDESLLYACAPWSPAFVFKLNDPEGSGNWGAVRCPDGTFLYGSSLYGIPRGAKNKEAAWAALQWAFQTREGSEAIRDVQGQVTIYKPAAMEEKFYYQEDPFFKGQAWLQMLADEAMNIVPREATVYDVIVDEAISLGNQALSVGASVEDALKVVKDEILRKAPGLT